ncbi:5,10-methenyltetrahydrofolate synthetase (5-formyltetrahydrofolate cyclo-ligase) isoform X1 [Betta splendens]|uniref:5-formyltetrahydrofolate cyclo-ligase n=1 Tax=Betta splendens TaxID=158456 RepID=A0A6P7KUI7_BETSP|nr:5,10-methenyltetrahydrofolate synthetase (5-formyltetrahydrofolate cyclo-ligase) isoform X1 [Betta splendens]
MLSRVGGLELDICCSGTMAALRTAKQELRKEIKRRIAALSEEEKRQQSVVVSQKLFQHPKYLSCTRIAVFLNMSDEVHTEEIIKDIFKQGKTCFVPKYKISSRHMVMLQVRSLHDIETLPLTSWNIRQPEDDDNSREEAFFGGGLDLILVPGLGFDPLGRRLGRGKGFYDSYLQRCMKQLNSKPYTIALAYKEQLCQEIPVNSNDVLVDEILYEDDAQTVTSDK